MEQIESIEAFAKPSRSLIWSAAAPFGFPQHLAPKQKDLAAERRRDACSGYPTSDVTRLHFMPRRDIGVFAYEVEPKAKVLRGSRGFRPRAKLRQCKNWEEHKGVSLP